MPRRWPFKAYQLHCLIGVGAGCLQIRAYRRNAQDSATICHNLSVCLLSSRMEHIVAVLILEVLQSVNGEALLIGYRITAGSQHHADCRVVLEFQIDLIQGAVHTGLEHIHNIRFHPGQDYLGLRIAEPRVVLQYPGALRGQHQAEENDALKFSALRSHGVHGLLVNMLPAEPIYLFCIEGAG